MADASENGGRKLGCVYMCINVRTKMDEYLRMLDFDGLATFCEQAELESLEGIASPDVYSTLLAVYLLQNELDHARMLWKRIPKHIKEECLELSMLWSIASKLCREQYSDVYSIVKDNQWSANVSPILASLTASVQSRILKVIGIAYSFITVESALELTGLTEEELQKEISLHNWQLEKDGKVIRIENGDTSSQTKITAKEALSKLSTTVSFLEC